MTTGRSAGIRRGRGTPGTASRGGNRGGGRGGGQDDDHSGAGGERDGRGTATEADFEAIARQICLRLLAAAPRTQAQLTAALSRRGVPEDVAAAVLERFAEVKLIDDELFAKAWVESRHHGRGLAGRALGAELRQRGVGVDDIATALSQLDPEQELATARELVERRLAATAGLPAPARMRRLAGVLARKGYSPGLAYRVVREALERETDVASGMIHALDELPESADYEVPREP